MEVVDAGPPEAEFSEEEFSEDDSSEDEFGEEFNWEEAVDSFLAEQPLCGAVLHRNLERLEALAAASSQADVRAAFHLAVEFGYGESVDVLLEAPGQDVNTHWPEGLALGLDVEWDLEDEVPDVRWALHRKFDPKGWSYAAMAAAGADSPLEKAAALGHTDIARKLLAAGAAFGAAHMGLLRCMLTVQPGTADSRRHESQPTGAEVAELIELLLSACAEQAADIDPAAGQDWHLRTVHSTLKSLLDPLQGTAWSPGSATRLSLETLLSMQRQQFLDGRYGSIFTHFVVAMMTASSGALEDVNVARLWAAAPALRTASLVTVAEAAVRNGSQEVLAFLLSRPPMQLELRQVAAWARREVRMAKFSVWRREVPAKRPVCSVALGDELAEAHAQLAVTAATKNKPAMLRQLLDAGYTLTIHSVNRVVKHATQAHNVDEGLQPVRTLLAAAKGGLPPVPSELASLSWCPIQSLLVDHHRWQQQQLVEFLVDKGYSPTTFDSILQANGTLVVGAACRALVESPANLQTGGAHVNRYLWLAAEHPCWSPLNNSRFPSALRAAVRALLLAMCRAEKPGTPKLVRRRRPGGIGCVPAKQYPRPPNILKLVHHRDVVHHIINLAAYPLSAWNPSLS